MPDPIRWPKHLPADVINALRNIECPPVLLHDSDGRVGEAAKAAHSRLWELAIALDAIPWIEIDTVGAEAMIDWPGVGPIIGPDLLRLEMSLRVSHRTKELDILIRAALAVTALSDAMRAAL